MEHRHSYWLTLAVALTLAACGSPNPVEGLELAPIDEAAPPQGPSAPQIFAVALGVALNPPDGGCPSVTDDGTTVTIAGGCTTPEGVEYFGSLSYPASSVPGFMNGTLVYDGFGTNQSAGCTSRPEGATRNTTSGTVDVSTTGTTTSFDVDLTVLGEGVYSDCSEGLREAGILYSGTVRSENNGERTTWNGRGQIGGSDVQFGASTVTGRYEVETRDEVIENGVCDSEALSGETTIVGTRTVVLRYDGATDCDAESTVTWTLDGAVQDGELSGVRCSATPGRRGSWVTLLVLGVIALVLARRRVGAG